MLTNIVFKMNSEIFCLVLVRQKYAGYHRIKAFQHYETFSAKHAVQHTDQTFVCSKPSDYGMLGMLASLCCLIYYCISSEGEKCCLLLPAQLSVSIQHWHKWRCITTKPWNTCAPIFCWCSAEQLSWAAAAPIVDPYGHSAHPLDVPLMLWHQVTNLNWSDLKNEHVNIDLCDSNQVKVTETIFRKNVFEENFWVLHF